MEKVECIIIGQGPAGLSAAIYTSRAGIDTMILGCNPKVAGDYDIDNYFGFEETITGKDLIEKGITQAQRFGTRTSCEKVLSIHYGDDGSYLVKTDIQELETCSIILATGVSRKKPNIENLDNFEGKGVSYCVSCDGFFFKNKKVMVIGEGNYAANQAIELTGYTPDVTICTNGFPKTITPEFIEKLKENNISILDTKISSLEGNPGLDNIIMENGDILEVNGLFIAMGDASSSDFAKSLGIMTSGIFLQADREQKTNVPGIFAAGDCTGGFLQISVAVGEGAVAAKSAITHIKEICRKK